MRRAAFARRRRITTAAMPAQPPPPLPKPKKSLIKVPPKPCCGCWCHRQVTPNLECSISTCGHDSCRLPLTKNGYCRGSTKGRWEGEPNLYELTISDRNFVDPRGERRLKWGMRGYVPPPPELVFGGVKPPAPQRRRRKKKKNTEAEDEALYRELEAKIKAWAPVEEPEPPYRPPTPDEEGVLEYVEAPPPLIDDDNTT